MSFYRAYIQFPDESELTISRNPNQSSGDTYIQAVPKQEGTFQYLTASVEHIRKNLPFYPKAFIKNGVNVSFDHIYLPGGVYKVRYSIYQGNEQTNIYELAPQLNTVYVDTVLKEAAEYIAMVKCDKCPKEMEDILDMSGIIISLKNSAQKKFEEAEYKKATLHVQSAERYAHKIMECLKRLNYV